MVLRPLRSSGHRRRNVALPLFRRSRFVVMRTLSGETLLGNTSMTVTSTSFFAHRANSACAFPNWGRRCCGSVRGAGRRG